jgi:WD repeat-containing protein 55
VHDFQSILSNDDDEEKATRDEDAEEEEDDTIVSSTAIHSQLIPNKKSGAENAYQKASCRAVLFSNNKGQHIYTGGSAGDLVCIDATRVCTFSAKNMDDDPSKSTIVWRIDAASVGTSHHNPLHVLHQLPETCSKGSLIVSGDDHGGVRLWDARLCNTSTSTTTPSRNGALQLPQGCVLSWKEHQDYISAFSHSEDGNTLLATSSDGCLSVFDIRKASTSNILQNQQYVKKSDPQDDELLCLATMKHGKKVVAGTQQGVLAIWSWGTWGDSSDRFPNLCPSGNSLDAILKLDEDTLLAGTSDGLLRVVSMHPNKLLGVLGEHDHGYPIESLQFTANRKFVGSISHDPYIRLWDTKKLILHDDDDDDEDKDDHEMVDETPDQRNTTPAGSATRAATLHRGGQSSDDEWDDMDEDNDDEVDEDEDADEDEDCKDDDKDDDSDDSDSDDEKPPTRNDNRAKGLKTQNEEFFADL